MWTKSILLGFGVGWGIFGVILFSQMCILTFTDQPIPAVLSALAGSLCMMISVLTLKLYTTRKKTYEMAISQIHKEICIPFNKIKGRYFEAVGFLEEGESFVSYEEMIERVTKRGKHPIDDIEDVEFLKGQLGKFPHSLRKFWLIADRNYISRSFGCFYFTHNILSSRWVYDHDDSGILTNQRFGNNRAFFTIFLVICVDKGRKQ